MIEPERDGTNSDRLPNAERELPAADIFFEFEPVVTAPPLTPPSDASSRPPGPGIWESIAWMAGVLVVQILAAIGAIGVLVAAAASTMDHSAIDRHLVDLANRHALAAAMGEFLSRNMIFLAGASQMATLAYALVAMRLRFGRFGISRLGWQFPAAGHSLLVVLMVVPLQLLCGKLLLELSTLLPGPTREYAEQMQALAAAPLPILLLIIALGPALAEELLFRGLIGRGLLARWGVGWGILLTSLLFGVVHLNPVQAIAVIPMGIAMHFVYLATRSFWAPVALHLLNNGLAAAALKFDLDVTFSALPTQVLTASAAMLTAIALLLWQTRVQYRLRDGTIWDPGYVSAEAPPPGTDALPVRQEPRLLLVAGSAFNSLGFAAVLWRLAAA